MIDFIVIESGGTKSTWALGSINNGLIQTIETVGLHPQELTPIKKDTIKQLLLGINYSSKTKVFFYGAGCSDINKPLISKFFLQFSLEDISIYTDLEGACIATLNNNPGYAAILGTGAISAQYDGQKVVSFKSGFGYLLGDEGSGFDLGKRLLNLYFNNKLNKDVSNEIENYFGGANQILHVVYSTSGRMKVAGLAQIIHKHKEDRDINKLIHSAFHDFYITALKDFDDLKKVSFIGSIAYYFEEELRFILSKYSIQVDKIFKAAIDELFNFHLNSSKKK